jgi:regulator of sirC expression with transglutaminase-like and TPR domain
MSSLRFEAPSLLDYFATLVADDSQFSLLEAAITIGQDDDPLLDVQGVLSQIDALAARLKQRLAADASAIHRLRCLNRYFFQELGFAGNVNDYYDLHNSYLQRVLGSRRGIPITLALLYIEIAQHIGLDARPVSFPGHFLVKLKMPQGEVIIDPFSGQSLSREALEERLAPLGLFLQAASGRDVLARMLRNLKEIHRSAEDWPRLLAVQQRLVILLPEAWEERRDRGLVWAELGHREEAAADLRAYLEHRPDADDAHALAERLLEMHHTDPPPRLH